MMNFGRVFSLFLLFLFAATQSPLAAGDGFGVSAGVSNFSSSGSISSGTYGGESFSVSGSGISLGIDYQIALMKDLTVNPFLSLSNESASSDQLSYTSASHTRLGAHLLYHKEQYYFGGHLAQTSESFSGGTGSEASGSGVGFGLIGGWERENGLIVSAQFDSAPIDFDDGSSDVTGILIKVGYRWGAPQGLLYNGEEEPPKPTMESIEKEILNPTNAQPPADSQAPTDPPAPDNPPAEEQPPVDSQAPTETQAPSEDPSAAEEPASAPSGPAQ